MMSEVIEVDIVGVEGLDDGECCELVPTLKPATCGPALFASWKRGEQESCHLVLVVRNCGVPWDLAAGELRRYARWLAMKACCSSTLVETKTEMGWYEANNRKGE